MSAYQKAASFAAIPWLIIGFGLACNWIEDNIGAGAAWLTFGATFSALTFVAIVWLEHDQ